MVIRKPYAFLIKYFKIIHIAIFITLIFLLFKLRNIYMFFKNYLLIKYGLRVYKVGILNYSSDKLWSKMWKALK